MKLITLINSTNLKMRRNHYKLNSDGKLVRVENKRMPIDEVNFPDDVLDSEFKL